MPSPVRRDPILGSQIFIRLLPAGAGKAVEARGFEEPSLSGHYAAKVTVPDERHRRCPDRPVRRDVRGRQGLRP